MARLPGLLRRTSKAEELALEEARQGSIARLERLLAHRAGVALDDETGDETGDELPEAAAAPSAPPVVLALGPGAPQDPPKALDPSDRDEEVAGRAEAGPTVVGVAVMDAAVVDATRRLAVRHRPSALVVEDDWDADGSLPADGATNEAAGGDEPAHVVDTASDAGLAAAPGSAGDPDPAPARRTAARAPRRRPVPVDEAAQEPGKATAPAPGEGRRAVPPPPPRAGARAVPAHPARPKRQPRQPVVLAACPSCAVLLDPRPATSRRCARCRERIVVKRVEGGVLYLTASAASALEDAQRAVKRWARLARARDRWLILAEAAGAPSQRIERVARPMPSEEQVVAARELYVAAAGRAFATARRERRFADAAAIRRTQALALHRDLGSPSPVPDDILALQREALTAELRTLRDVGRDAELVTTCCEACRVDAGRIVRISDELRVGRLPHPACEAGLCRCRWAPARTGGRRPAVARLR